MKKIVTASLFIMALAACNEHRNAAFSVSGKADNAPAAMIYLEQLGYTNIAPTVSDSAKLDAGGTYALKGNSTEENLYLLTFDHNPAIIFVNDGSDIKINFDLKNFTTPSVTGSAATEKLYAFLHTYSSRDSVLSATYDKIDTLNSRHPEDTATMKILQAQGLLQMKALNDDISSFVKSSSSPASVCFVLDKARVSMNQDEISGLLKDAMTKFPSHTGLAIFKTTLVEAAAPPVTSNTYALLNKPAPDLTMNDVNGQPLSISSFKGKYVLIDFWASWCGPCRLENPNVVAAYNSFKDKNFTILGVSLDQDRSSWLSAIKKDGLAWQQMSDLKYWDSEAVNAYGIDGIPFNVLIDPQGKIIASSLKGDALQAKLAEVLK